MTSRKLEIWIFIAIIAITVFFRFYRLDLIPPGLWPDEAANGVDALKAINATNFSAEGGPTLGWKIFYPANNGREGLFINLQAVSIRVFGVTPWSLRVVSAVIGTLTVLGLYLLAKRLFDWRVAAISSFFLAVSFWHVNFSRIGFRAIMLPFILVWAFYFLWRGLRNGKLAEFFVAGLTGGLGFYTYFSFRIVPLIALVIFWNYWSYLKKDFTHFKYEHAKNQLLRGFALLMLTVIIIALPLLFYFYTHPEDFLKREGRPISVFAQERPMKELGISIVRTLGMFNFVGDHNQRHNIPGSPQLALPVGVLFAVGFLRELVHWLKRKHGHLSTVHTFLFSWFLVMLLPGFFSIEAPHALRTIGAIPVVMIFAAQGFMWLINLILRLHRLTDPHAQFNRQIYGRESYLLAFLAVIFFLSSIGFFEYSRYFRRWGLAFSTREAFVQRYVDIADYLNNAGTDVAKYILANEGDVLVDGVSNNAQTVKFLTRSHSAACSAQKNIYYLNKNQLQNIRFSDQLIVIPLADNPELRRSMLKYGLYPEGMGSFVVYKR